MVIALGYTGCGKSTMFYSLAFGPKSLKKSKIGIEVNDDIVSKKAIGKFKIGHSMATSETFKPEFYFAE